MTDPHVRCLGMVYPHDVSAIRAWLDPIPWEAWPQQKPINGQLRPAMVNDPGWYGFGAAVANLLTSLGPDAMFFVGPDVTLRNPVLSVVMPGHSIPKHVDAQTGGWVYRLHVALRTNPEAVFVTDQGATHMLEGGIYRVDTRAPHAIYNHGDEPRVHLMVDAYRDVVR